MKNIAIILAGGSGKRFLPDMPKLFYPINKKPLLFYTIEKFDSLGEIDEIVVATSANYLQNVKEMVEKYDFNKVKNVVQGGNERFHSVYACLKVYENSAEANVLIHDGVRPLVSHELIKRCLSSLANNKACVPLTKEKNTVFQVENERIVRSIDRNTLYCAQTPQCFRLSLIKKAYDEAIKAKDDMFTDDCSVLRKFLTDIEIKVVLGDEENIKITFLQDAEYMEFILEKGKSLRKGENRR